MHAKKNKGMSLVDFGISCCSFLLFHNTAVWIQQHSPRVLSWERLILQWLIKVRHHYWFIKEKNMHDAYRPTDDVLLNVSLGFPIIGSMHEFDQKGQTQGELWLRTHLAKILMKYYIKLINEGVKLSMKTAYIAYLVLWWIKSPLSTSWVLWEINSLVVISVIWTFHIYVIICNYLSPHHVQTISSYYDKVCGNEGCSKGVSWCFMAPLRPHLYRYLKISAPSEFLQIPSVEKAENKTKDGFKLTT